MVQELLDRHADGRLHPVTRYSPLYIACFKGRKDVVQIVLKVGRAWHAVVCVCASTVQVPARCKFLRRVFQRGHLVPVAFP